LRLSSSSQPFWPGSWRSYGYDLRGWGVKWAVRILAGAGVLWLLSVAYTYAQVLYVLWRLCEHC
jgi:hypothetical protein